MPTKLQELVWEAQLRFLKQQLDSRISVPANKLYDQSKWFMDGINVRTKNYLTPFIFADPVTRTAIQAFRGDAIKTTKSGYIHDQVVVLAGAANLIPSALQFIEIYSIVGTLACSAAAANRVSQLEIFDGGVAGVPVDAHAQSHEMTLTAGQDGTIYWGHGPVESLNTNNVMAWTNDSNVLPSVFRPATGVYYDSTNLQIGDTMTLDVVYRLMGA